MSWRNIVKKLSLLKKKKNTVNTQDIYTNIGFNIENYVDKNIHSNMDKKYQLTEFFEIMKNFRQHCNTSCYQHSMQVAFYTYIACKKMRLDYVSATRAAMVHDLFLYDWRKKYRNVDLPGLHAFVHPKIALKNASQLFALNEMEKDIIAKHMWPVTFGLPKYRESYIVTVMDKYSACLETYLYIRSKLKTKTFYRYAYVFSSLLLFRMF